MSIIINAVIAILVLGMFIYGIYDIRKEYRNCKTLNEKIIFGIIVVVFSFPTIIFYIDYFNIPSIIGWTKTMDSKVWLESIIGYVVTIIASIIGAYVTICSVRMTIKDQERVRVEENKKKALPLLKITGEGEYDYRNKGLSFNCIFTEESKYREKKDIYDTANVTLKIQNVGMRELYNFCIGNIESTFFECEHKYHGLYPIIYKDDSFYINLSFYEMGIYDNDLSKEKFDTLVSPISFNCYFKDCYNNWYYQTIEVSLFHQIVKDTQIDKRALNISISNTQVITAPIEIDEKELPWKKENEELVHHL